MFDEFNISPMNEIKATTKCCKEDEYNPRVGMLLSMVKCLDKWDRLEQQLFEKQKKEHDDKVRDAMICYADQLKKVTKE